MVMMVGSAIAQSGTSGIHGVVTDQTGAAVPGATVTINNTATGFKRTSTTNDNGNYSFTGIPPATYRLEISAGSFKKAVNNSVQALVDSPIRIDIALETGDVSAIVDVTGDGIESVINVEDASVGNNFVAKQISELPSNLRRVTNLLTLQPNVTPGGSVAGARSNQTNYTLDGIDVNDAQGGTLAGGLALRLSTEALEEFRITTTNANANQGRSSGAQGTLITKSGTNRFSGSVFYYKRPTSFSANDFFSNKSSSERPKLDRDIYGGTIGGPIFKDKLFFFYSFEAQNDKKETVVNRLVPLSHLGNGELKFTGIAPGGTTASLMTLNTATLNTIFPQAGINPATVAVLNSAATNYASNNNDLGDGVNTGGFRFNSPTTTKENSHVAKFDYNLSDNHLISVRGNYQWDNAARTSRFPDTPSRSTWSHPTALAASHTWTLSSNMVNIFRYGVTRQAFSTQGDSGSPGITFREVFQPVFYERTANRVSSIQSYSDDFTWVKGNHTLQFGGVLRVVRNKRDGFAGAFDTASTNFSFYEGSGQVIDDAFTAAGYTISAGQSSIVQKAAAALIGRFSQYAGNFVFDLGGNIQPQGAPISRRFATEEVEFYALDSWKLFRNLTINAGIRYSLSRPVYEQNGFQVVPQTPLGELLDKRIATAAVGVPTNDPVIFELGGPVNNGRGFYGMDWNNWQPRISAAWTPSFKGGFLKTLFGEEGDSVIRGGFSVTNDNFGQQLAVNFDGLTHVGFTATSSIGANDFNVTDRLGPQFTGFNQDIRNLGNLTIPTLDLGAQSAGFQDIKRGLDTNIVSPVHYVWNVSFGRKLPMGMHIQATYIGRRARNLFAQTDAAAWNNIVDPISGMDWYTAGALIYDLRRANTPLDQVQPIPFFENLFPGMAGNFGQPTATRAAYRLGARRNVNNDATQGAIGGFNVNDWTTYQLILNQRGIVPDIFRHSQYASFYAFGSYAKSDYHGGSLTFRQRLGTTLTYDINYTYSKAMDNSSNDVGRIDQPIIPEANYRVSGFDASHLVNANFIFEVPFGKGRKFFGGINSWANAVVGGWQLSGIYRFNSGFPLNTPGEPGRWATNWNWGSSTVRTQALKLIVNRDTQQAFADPQAALNSLRSSKPGEIGDKNQLRRPGTQKIDLSLSKSFNMPWNENHSFKFQWDVFNVANYQAFNAGNFGREIFGTPADPDLATSATDAAGALLFGRIYNGIQGTPRFMQFGIKFEF